MFTAQHMDKRANDAYLALQHLRSDLDMLDQTKELSTLRTDYYKVRRMLKMADEVRQRFLNLKRV